MQISPFDIHLSSKQNERFDRSHEKEYRDNEKMDPLDQQADVLVDEIDKELNQDEKLKENQFISEKQSNQTQTTRINELIDKLKTRTFKDQDSKETTMINDKLKDTSHPILKKEFPWDNEETDESDKENDDFKIPSEMMSQIPEKLKVYFKELKKKYIDDKDKLNMIKKSQVLMKKGKFQDAIDIIYKIEPFDSELTKLIPRNTYKRLRRRKFF